MRELYALDNASASNQVTFNGTLGDGSGQKIAIVVGYQNTQLATSVDYFNETYHLPRFNTGGPTLGIYDQSGGTSLPGPAPTNWANEATLDVEWAHAIAPGANITVYEANDGNLPNMMVAETTAANSGASVVSNSWSFPDLAATESSYDSTFAGHSGVVFLGATGDAGAGPLYPAVNPNVIAVGGTTVSVNNDNTYGGEAVWSNNFGAGGGGISVGESQPAYQMGKVNGASSGYRVTPDVSMDADPYSGASMLDLATNNNNPSGFVQFGGTSLATPMWAGLIAIADQGRQVYNGGVANPLSSSQVLTALYDNLPANVLRDVTAGNNGYAATTGYDMASGLGTPLANLVVQQLAGIGTTPHLAFASPPSTVIAAGTGALPNFTVNVEDAGNNVISTDNSAITLSVYYNGRNNGEELATGNLTVNASSGVATFSNLWLGTVPNHAGSYVVQATDGNDIAATFNFTVVAAEARNPTPSVTSASFSSAVGSDPNHYGSVALDANGDIFGVASGGGANGFGSVFYVLKGTTTIKTLWSFDGTTSGGRNPNGGVAFDSSGDLFGTTSGGLYADGTVFEIKAPDIATAISSGNPAGSITTLVTFNGSNGANPFGGLAVNSSENVYGTTAYTSGNGVGSGTVFELTNSGGSYSFATLASFNGSNGANPYGGVVLDGNGNLFGTTVYGGHASNGTLTNFGTVFEVAAGTGTISTVWSFEFSDGAYPYGGVVLDANGNIYGTTEGGGANNVGTIFELDHVSNPAITLSSFDFNGSDPYRPYGTLAIDNNGDLFGTAQQGGAGGYGAVFELPAGSTTVTSLLAFNSSNGASPYCGVVLDAEGNLYGTASSGGSSGSGEVFTLSAVALPGWLKPGSAGAWDGHTLVVNTPPGSGSSASVNFGEAIVIQDPDASPFADVPNVNVSQAPGTIAHVQFQATPGSSFSSPNPIHVGNLDLENGSIAAIITTSTADTLQLIVTGLTIDTAHDSQFDMANDRLLINYGAPSADPMSTLVNTLLNGYLQTGFNGGAWDGPGIISSAAAAVYQANLNNPRPAPLTAIGYADAADGTGIDTMGANTIELAYVLAGDANLNDGVNSADLQIFLYNFNNLNRSWDTGDFNYDTICNSADQQIVLFNFNVTGP